VDSVIFARRSAALLPRWKVSKELFKSLQDRRLIEFGSVIKGDTVREILGIEYPEYGKKEDFDSVALRELSAIDYIRNILLGMGMYLGSNGGDYRIFLPSENKRQVDQYMAQADRKLRRALKLSRNMPKTEQYVQDNTTARIIMKRESIRSNAANP